MFSQFEPNVKVTIAFLKLLNVKVNASAVNETLQNHPDWPSLLCISDSLKKWNVPNGAGKIDVTNIDELPTPFIAYTNNREQPLAIVTAVNDDTIQFYSKNYQLHISIDRDSFFKNWTGTYLIAEPAELSGEKDYQKNNRKAFVNALVPVSLFILLSTLSFLLVYRNINSNLNIITVNTTAIYVQWLLLFAGVIITSLLLWYEIDKNNPLLQKVCTGIAKGDCNAILTGKQAKLFAWLSWSEIGFFYFTGGLLTLVIPTEEGSIFLLAWVSVLALPYTVFSIYYQWRVAKQWCVLCLAVQAILVLGGINIIANGLLVSSSIPPVSFLLKNFLFYLLPILTWYTVKPYILKLQQSKNTKREYLRIKFNTQIFETLLKKQKAITILPNGLGINFGNSAATNTLIKICNPYCGPCATAHPKIEKLLEDNRNLKVQIIFTTPNQPEQDAYKPVNHLLAIQEKNKNEKITKNALDDWYLSDTKNYEVFAAKYPMNGELSKQGNKIDSMAIWCKQMDIQATPTIFINGYQLPDAYSIEDLQYFLLE